MQRFTVRLKKADEKRKVRQKVKQAKECLVEIKKVNREIQDLTICRAGGYA